MNPVTRLALGLFAVTSITAHADILDDFNDGNDTGWTRVSPLTIIPPGNGAGQYTFPGGNSYNILAPAFGSASPGPGRAGSVRNDELYSQFTQIVDLVDWNTANPGNFMGMLARTTQIGLGTTDGYAGVLDALGNIYIARVTNEASTTIATGTYTYNATHDYRLVFSGVGAALTLQVYDLADLSAPPATINASDATYASGASGLIVTDLSGTPAGLNASATFDNYTSAVPEPATAAMLAFGALGLVARRIRPAKK